MQLVHVGSFKFPYKKTYLGIHCTFIGDRVMAFSIDKYRSRGEQNDEHVQTLWMDIRQDTKDDQQYYKQKQRQRQKQEQRQKQKQIKLQYTKFIYPKIRCINLLRHNIKKQNISNRKDKVAIIACRSLKLVQQLKQRLNQQQKQSVHFKTDQIPQKAVSLHSKYGYVYLTKNKKCIKLQKFTQNESNNIQSVIFQIDSDSDLYLKTLENMNDQIIITNKTRYQNNTQSECLQLIDFEYGHIIKQYGVMGLKNNRFVYSQNICLLNSSMFFCGVQDKFQNVFLLNLFDIRISRSISTISTSMDYNIDVLVRQLVGQRSAFIDYAFLDILGSQRPFNIISVLNIGFGMYCYPVMMDIRKLGYYELLVKNKDNSIKNVKEIIIQQNRQSRYLWTINKQNPEEYNIIKNKFIF